MPSRSSQIRQIRKAITLIELIVVLAIIAILLALLLPAIQRARSASQSIKCKNNLKQIGIALYLYHDQKGMFPPGVSSGSQLEPYPDMSWLTRLLPFIEQNGLWDESIIAYGIDPFFESPSHFPILKTVIPSFICPADFTAGNAWNFVQFEVAFTSYLGVEGTNQLTKDGLLYRDSQVRAVDVTDGLSNTLMVGERPPSADRRFGWWYAGWGQSRDGSCDMVLGARELIVDPLCLDCPASSNQFQQGNPKSKCDMFHFWSFHQGGANFLLADGSVRFLGYEFNSVLPALATRGGGEVVGLPD